MKIVELITYFRNGGSFEDFCQSQSLDLRSEVVEIFMVKPFNLTNDLMFFEIEKTEGKIRFDFKGETYFNLFDFYYFLDAIEESNEEENKQLNDEEIADKLLSYAINNA